MVSNNLLAHKNEQIDQNNIPDQEKLGDLQHTQSNMMYNQI